MAEPSREHAKRKTDKGIHLLLQGYPLVIILAGAIGTGALMWGTLQGTVMAQGKAQKEQSERQVETNTRVRTLEQGQAVITNELKHIRETQRSLGKKMEDGQRAILDELRRERTRQ